MKTRFFATDLLRHLGRLGGCTVLASCITATYYRPLYDHSFDSSEGDKFGPSREMSFFCSQVEPSTIRRDQTPFLLAIARYVSISVTTLLIRIFMSSFGEYRIENDENYSHFLSLVLGGHGRAEKHQALLTCSNHRSMFDDPGVMACVLPLWMALQPKYVRWGLCSQEYCFNDNIPAFIKGYIGAGQVLPICRGCSINQKLLYDFASLLAQGEWCHIFPEAGIWQKEKLGGRNQKGDDSKHLGTLKWGIGKLIAHSPIPPRVVPIAFAGMEAILPQDENGKTHLEISLTKKSPLNVFIKVGKELFFDDLIADHEKIHGKLWKIKEKYDSEILSSNVRGLYYKYWESSDAEKILYHKITLRVEKSLEELVSNVLVTVREC